MITRISYSLAMWCVLSGTCLAQQQLDLVGHWKLAGDCRDYSGSARYNAQGSLLVKSPNWQPGGRVYRFEGGQNWTDCGQLGEANEVIGMAVFQGKLFAGPLPSAANRLRSARRLQRADEGRAAVPSRAGRGGNPFAGV